MRGEDRRVVRGLGLRIANSTDKGEPMVGTRGQKIELKELSRSAFDTDGKLRSFSEQLRTYAYDEMPSGDMFIVTASSRRAGVMECADYPIIMKQKTIKKVMLDHEIPLTVMEDLTDWLRTYPLALDSLSEPNALLIIANALDRHGYDILVAMHLEKEKRNLVINEISSVYGKRNLSFLIENTYLAGLNIYTNERTGEWLQRTGLQLPERTVARPSDDILPKMTSPYEISCTHTVYGRPKAMRADGR